MAQRLFDTSTRHLVQAWPSLHTLRAARYSTLKTSRWLLPDNWTDVCKTMLQLDPARRATASAVLRQLDGETWPRMRAVRCESFPGSGDPSLALQKNKVGKTIVVEAGFGRFGPPARPRPAAFVRQDDFRTGFLLCRARFGFVAFQAGGLRCDKARWGPLGASSRCPWHFRSYFVFSNSPDTDFRKGETWHSESEHKHCIRTLATVC